MGKLRRKPRNYQGNPLAYYEEHSDKYEGMGRGGLSLSDSGLYRSLLRAGQLEKAITDDLRIGNKNLGRKPVSNDGITNIVNLHSLHNGNASKASEDSPYHVSTILKYWKEKKLRIGERGRPMKFSNDEINWLVNLYALNNGNAYQASKNSSYATNTIIRYWRKKGLDIRKVGRPKTI